MSSSPIKTIFCGTPEFSVPYLEGLLNNPDFSVLGALTQPDKPSGRKQKLSPSPVKILAQKNNLKIWQPEKLKNNLEINNELRRMEVDLLVVVAYGQIMPQEILNIFPSGAINVHPSLLPKYRGASPIQSALLAGEKETGITIMLMDDKMDHGPVLAQQKIQLTGEETNESLHGQLTKIGVELLIETIKKYLGVEIKPQEQDHSAATFCAVITKDSARINWQEPARQIKHKIYAFYPWPATWTVLDNKRLKIFPPVVVKTTSGQENKKAGQIQIDNSKLIVICGSNELELEKIQLEGKKEMLAEDFIRGYKDLNCKILG